MTKRIDTVVVPYRLDSVLAGIYIDEQGNGCTIRERLQREKNVRDWYMEAFPTDSLGSEIDGSLTWAALLRRLRALENVYGIIGVDDSIVRERIFGRLAKLLCVPYLVVYNLWCHENILTTER